ncbi:MAG: hypothetical protein QXT14_07530 [Candidatus Bathyarchaeia archaeon]
MQSAEIEKLKDIMDRVGFHSQVYELLSSDDLIRGSVILSEKFDEALRDDYLYPSYASISYENIKEDAMYELDEDLVFEYSYYDMYPSAEEDEEGPDLEEMADKIARTLELLADTGVPMVVYENSSPDFYVIRALIFKKIS